MTRMMTFSLIISLILISVWAQSDEIKFHLERKIDGKTYYTFEHGSEPNLDFSKLSYVKEEKVHPKEHYVTKVEGYKINNLTRINRFLKKMGLPQVKEKVIGHKNPDWELSLASMSESETRYCEHIFIWENYALGTLTIYAGWSFRNYPPKDDEGRYCVLGMMIEEAKRK